MFEIPSNWSGVFAMLATYICDLLNVDSCRFRQSASQRKEKVKVRIYGLETHHRATERHPPYGITQTHWHPTQVNAPRLNPSHAGRYSIYLPRRDGRLSWSWWLVIYRGGIRAFWDAGQSNWDALPNFLKISTLSLSTFRRHLKHFAFFLLARHWTRYINCPLTYLLTYCVGSNE